MERRSRWDSIAGLLAAAVALGVGELVASLLRNPSLVISVGNAVVQYTPGRVVKAAIEALGTNDKPTLLLAVTIMTVAIGALLGPIAARRPLVGTVAFVSFGLIGAAALARSPLTPVIVAIVISTAAAVTGLLTLRQLLGAATPTAVDGSPTPGRGIANRRRFLMFAASAAGGSAAAAITGRIVSTSAVDVEAQRRALALPPVEGGGAIAGVSGLQVPGLSPLVTPNDDFYRIDTALTIPRIDARQWRLRITGMVDHPYELTFQDLLALPVIEKAVTLACVSNEVGGDLIGNAIWRGTPLAGILARAGVQPGATQIVGRSVDGFTVGFPTEVALDGRTSMVAFGMNGEALPVAHGFPARLVVAGLYGYVSATKWLSELQLTTLAAFDAYWIPRGWDKLAPIITQSRIDVPHDGKTVAPGHVAIAGVAWGGIRGVSAVDVSVRPRNGNAADVKWLPARLSDALSGSTWRQWVVDWDATAGEYQIEVRATDGRGDTQTAVHRPPGPNGATGYHRIGVRIR